MKEKQLTKDHSDMILRIERCIKRFEKLEKKLQQPWRNCDAKEVIHSEMKNLNDLTRKVRSGEFVNGRVRDALKALNLSARLIDIALLEQNEQKASGKEITPFSQL